MIAASSPRGWAHRPSAWVAVYCGVLLLLGVAFWDQLSAIGLSTASRLVVIVSVALLIVTIAAAPAHLVSPSVVLLLALFVFHFGLLILVSVGIDPLGRDVLGPTVWFVESPRLVEAVLLAGGGFVATCLGVALAHSSWRIPHLPEAWTSSHPQTLRLVAVGLGNSLVVSFVTAWFALGLIRGGADIYVGAYAEFRTLTEDFALPFIYFGIAAGLLIMAAAGWDRRHYVGLFAFAVFMAVALAVGVRTETLLPLGAAVVVFVKAERAPRMRVVVVAVLVGLSVVAAVREFRQAGVADADVGSVSANPVDALAELGSGLRPLLVVLDWRGEGEGYRWGATYWAPIERQLALVVPGLDRVPAEEDDRLLNTVVSDRVGAIGFSILAEAHHNFAAPGMIVVMVLVGFVVGVFDRWRSSIVANALVGFTMLHLLRHVRNSFTPLPVEMFLSLVVLGLVWVIAVAYDRAGGRDRPVRETSSV